MKTIAIKADGSLKIGLGHIMRTLVIANQLSKENYVYYICKNSEEYNIGKQIIKENKFDIIYENDKSYGDLIIVDTYNITEHYLSNLRNSYKKTMYIDDLNNLNFYDVDLLLNRNLGAEHLIYNVPKNCIKLLGAKYMILREEFRKLNEIKINDNISNIVITFGGSDPTNTTLKVLKDIKDINYNLKVIIGNSFSDENINSIKSLAKDVNNIQLYYSPKVSDIFSKCDLAITACGGTIYELSALGIPAIGITVADNQLKIAEYADKIGVINLIGNYNNIDSQKLIQSIYNLANNKQKRMEMSQFQKDNINKNGIFEIISEIKKL